MGGPVFPCWHMMVEIVYFYLFSFRSCQSLVGWWWYVLDVEFIRSWALVQVLLNLLLSIMSDIDISSDCTSCGSINDAVTFETVVSLVQLAYTYLAPWRPSN